MKNKILSVALMCVAVICILAAPIAASLPENDIPSSQPESSVTVVTTTAPESSEVQITEGTTTPTATQSPDETEQSKATESSITTTTAKSTETNITTTTPKTTATSVTTTPKKTTTTSKSTTTTAKKTTTTTTTTTTAKKPEPPSGTPVEIHGQLSVKGANIVDKNGKPFQLIGMSTHGLGWFPDAVSKNSFKVFRDDWGCNAMRLAMYIEESWGGSESLYLAQPDKNYKLVTEGVDACIDLGMYVIVDWHILNPGDPNNHTAEAKDFFDKLSKKYANCPNIIYEICNEPNSGPDWNRVKTYANAVIPVIRANDPDAIIVCGTPTWSQDIDRALSSPLDYSNVVYALHFYANTHTDWLRDRLKNCYNSGLPVLVTEYGTCDASGNGGFNTDQTKKWLDLMDSLNIGYFNWSFCNKGETASAFKGGTNLSNISAGESQLTESGKLIRKLYRKRAGLS